LYVGNINHKVRPREVEKLFAEYGELVDFDFKDRGQQVNFCFVEYRRSSDAESAITNLSGRRLLEAPLIVELARDRNEKKSGSHFNSFGRNPRGKRRYDNESSKSRSRSRSRNRSRSRTRSRSRSRRHSARHAHHNNNEDSNRSHSKSKSKSKSKSGHSKSRSRSQKRRHSSRHDRSRRSTKRSHSNHSQKKHENGSEDKIKDSMENKPQELKLIEEDHVSLNKNVSQSSLHNNDNGGSESRSLSRSKDKERDREREREKEKDDSRKFETVNDTNSPPKTMLASDLNPANETYS